MDPRLQHHDTRDCKAKDVREWLSQTGESETWGAGSEGGSCYQVLFCSGDLGAGNLILGNLDEPQRAERATSTDRLQC